MSAVTNAIWNRAVLEDGGKSPRPGDVALASMMHVHGLVMNGGVGHAAETMSPEALAAGANGYRYYGFEAAFAIITEAQNMDPAQITDGTEARLDRAYDEAATDQAIEDRFIEKFTNSPDQFAPLTLAKD